MNQIDFTPDGSTSPGSAPANVTKIDFTPNEPPPLNEAPVALGSSNTILGNVLKGGWGALQGVSQGFAKGGMNTALGLAELGAKAVGAKETAQNIETTRQQVTTTQNTAEDIGKGVEQIGEFFIPGGAEKTAFTKGASLIDKIPQALGVAGKYAGKITTALKTALQGAITGASMGTVTAAQTAGDMNAVKGAAELGGIAGTAGKALEVFGPQLSKYLNKADFRLSPAQEAKTSKIADKAAEFITKNKILGTDTTKFKKLTMLNNNLESVLQKSLPEEAKIPTQGIVEDINRNVEALRTTDPAIYNQARAKADEAIGLLKSPTIGIKDALSGKRSWASMAFKLSKKGKADPTVASEGAYAVEQAYQKGIEDILSKRGEAIEVPKAMQKYFDGAKQVSISDFNKVYSSAINAKNLTGIAQYKSDAGLFGRLFGLWVGRSIGNTIAPGLMGEIVGAGIGEAASTHIPGAVRNVSERILAAPSGTLPGAAKTIQGVENQ